MVAGAVGALYGPLHGGANEAVLRMLEARAMPACTPPVPATPAILYTECAGYLHPCAPWPPLPKGIHPPAGPVPLVQRIGSVENVGTFLEGVKNRKERMFGFGHR